MGRPRKDGTPAAKPGAGKAKAKAVAAKPAAIAVVAGGKVRKPRDLNFRGLEITTARLAVAEGAVVPVGYIDGEGLNAKQLRAVSEWAMNAACYAEQQAAALSPQ